MEIVASLTEQTTAATDAILGILALCLAGFLLKYAKTEPWRTRIWQGLLVMTAGVSLTGAVAHGIVMPKATYELLWKPMLLCLGMVVAVVVLAAVYDLWGRDRAKKWLPWLGGVAVLFFGLTQMPGTTFLIFILYEVAGMLFGLGAYATLAIKNRLPGAGIVTAGIALQILAAGVQAAGPFEVRFIWHFDHNGIFHIIGMVATGLMVYGVARGMGDRQPS